VAQKVYRCGSTYSQIPCADGTTLEVQDARTRIQKSQADAAIKSEAATANAMEKARLKEEAQALSSGKPSHPAPSKGVTPKPNTKEDAKSVEESSRIEANHKAAAKKKKDAEYFTAQVAPEKKKAASAPK
jgi:hypothetical protein